MADQIIVPGLAAATDKPLSALVTRHANQVVLHLSEPREFVAFTGTEPIVIGTQMLCRAMEANPDGARSVLDMCAAIMDFAYELRGDLKPAGSAVKHELIERHRKTLTKRLEVVMNSQREKKTTTNYQLAKELVDIALREIFS